jgi:hypothetical protein
MKALLLAVLVAGAALPSRAAPAGAAESPQELEGYRIKARQDLTLLGDRLAALELAARVEQKRAREDLMTRTGELRAQKSEADRLFGRIDTGTNDERRAAREKLDEAIRDLRTGIEKAESAHRDWGSSRPAPPVRAPLAAYS